MSTDREILAARLRPFLSQEEGRTCGELLRLAGLSADKGRVQSAARVLTELVMQGVARREQIYGHSTRFFAALSPVDGIEERIELPELDATLVFRTTVTRPHGAPSDRTTLAVTCALGPSWPEGAHVPGWSTSLFASQVAQGGLGSAKTNGTARMRAALSALRAAPASLPPPPSPAEVSVLHNDLIPDLLAYCAGVAGGAKDSSVHSWLKARRLSRTKAEELIEQLVAEGRLQVVERPIAGGEVVVRYLPGEPTSPAPLPTSDAPSNEVEEAIEEAIEEPTLIAGDAVPCAECERLRHSLWEANSRSQTLAHQVEDWERRYREADRGNACAEEQARAESDRLRQERDLAQGEAYGLRQQLGEARRQDSIAWQQVREDLDTARRQLSDHEGDWALLRSYLSLSDKADRQAILDRTLAVVNEARAAASDPGLDGPAVAHYLLTLPEGHWASLATARAQLAQARTMAGEAQRLEAAALDAVHRLLGTPAGAPPAPAPDLTAELVPPPPPPPASEEQPAGTMNDRVLEHFRAHPTAELRAADLADALGGDRQGWTAPLSILTSQGLLERVGRGLYRLTRRGRRAA